MKKRFLFVIFAVVIAAIAAAALGCGDDDVVAKTYTVSVEFDSTRGAVSVESPSGKAKSKFVKGDTAVIKPVPSDDYALVYFSVDGVKVETTNGEYRLTVTKNHEIEAVFGISEMTQEILDASKTSVEITGSYEHSENGGAPSTNLLKTVFGAGEIYIEERDSAGALLFADVYVNRDGKLAQVSHTIDNTIDYSVSEESFADYYNPFMLLAPADFETTEKADVLKIIDSDKAKAAAMAVTGWNEKIGLFEVKVDGGKITEIHIETAEGATVDGIAYRSDYKFTLSGHGATEVDPEFTRPYEHGDEHDTLRAALTEMALSKNYTVSVIDVLAGDDDVVFDIYVTETAIYDDCPGYYNGWVLSEGVVRPFERFPGQDPEITVYDPLNNVSSIAAIRAAFIGYAPELFALTESDDDGKVYTLRCNDLAGKIFPEFGDGIDRMQYYSFAVNGQIILDESDKLMGVRFDYYMYGYYGSITLMYSDVNSTVLPAELDFSDVVVSSVFDAYLGTYTDGEHTVVITVEDGITIDGVIAEVKNYDSQTATFTVNLDGVELYVGKKSTVQLLVFNENYTICYELFLQNVEPVVIAENYRGIWSGIFYDETTKEATDVAYDQAADRLTFKIDGGNCSLEMIDSDTVVLVGYGEQEYTLTRGEPTNGEGCAIIPVKFTGAYEVTLAVNGEKVNYVLDIYKDVIEFSVTEPLRSEVSIASETVMLDGVELQVLSYSEKEGLVCYNDDNRVTYNFFILKSNAEIDVITYDGANRLYDFYIFDSRVEFVEVPELFVGTFTGFDSGTVTDYTMIATPYGVKIIRASNGESVTTDAVVKKVETVSSWGVELCQMTIEVGGVEYTVTETSEAGRIEFANEADRFSVYLEKQTGGDEPSGDIPEKFYGDFMSSDGNALVCIDETGVTYVMLDGVEKDVVFIEYDATESYISITLDGETFTVSDVSYSDPVNKIMIANDNYSVMVMLERYAE